MYTRTFSKAKTDYGKQLTTIEVQLVGNLKMRSFLMLGGWRVRQSIARHFCPRSEMKSFTLLGGLQWLSNDSHDASRWNVDGWVRQRQAKDAARMMRFRSRGGDAVSLTIC
jgi:hypothetical protein